MRRGERGEGRREEGQNAEQLDSWIAG